MEGYVLKTPALRRAPGRHGLGPLLAAALWAPGPAHAGVLMSQKEALALAFPEGTAVERRTAFLSEEETRRAQERARARVESRVWSYYVGRSTGGLFGYAYFETHVVRTMPETFMVALSSAGEVRFVEVLAFHEPPDYQARPKWLAQLLGRRLDAGALTGRPLANITGATLTAHAISDGVRRILAVHAVIQEQKK